MGDSKRILGNVGEVIHVNGNLYLTKNSSPDDFLHAVRRVRGALDALEIPVADRKELDLEFEEALAAAAGPKPDTDQVIGRLERTKAGLESLGEVTDAALTLATSVDGLTTWATKFLA